METTTLPFQVGEPVEHRGIVVAPLFPLRDPIAGYVTLDEALPRGLAITETSEAGRVPELAVSNPLDEAALLYDGEELVGAKQNRILNVSVLVAGRSKLTVPVSCVEQGRWRSISRTFAAAPHVSNADLRRAKAHALAAAAQELADSAVQREVWRSVDENLGRLGVASTTSANRDAFLARESELAALEGAFEAEPGQCGAVLALGDTLCLDAVSRPEAFARLWPKLRPAIYSTRSSASMVARPGASACSASSTRSPTLPWPAGSRSGWARMSVSVGPGCSGRGSSSATRRSSSRPSR